MKNIFMIIFILCLGIFVVAGCADDSGGGNSGANMENTGDGGNTGEVYTPEFTKLTSLGGLSYGETVDGKRYVWGNAGELAGAGNKDEVTTPVEVDFTINKILDNDTKYFLTDKGLYAWGNNSDYQVGNGTTENVTIPYKAVNGNIKDLIISGPDYSTTYYALTADGLYAWGDNFYGQVGNGISGNVLTPYKIKEIPGNIKEVIIYDSTVYVLAEDGLYSWGRNTSGQVGNGNTENVTTPNKTLEGNIKDLIISDIGMKVTCYALREDSLYAWGSNYYGQVGNGTTDNVLTPYKVKIKKQN